MTSIALPAHNVDVNVLKENEATFKDACSKRGLLADDGEWTLALQEAANVAYAHQIRALFLHILCYCQPKDPLRLFERFCQAMGDDFRQKLQADGLFTEERVRAMVIFELNSSLDEDTNAVDRLAKEYLPQLTDAEKAFIQSYGQTPSQILAHVYDYDVTDQGYHYQIMYNQCKNVRQQKAFLDAATEMVNNDEQMLTFLDAPGGYGKTHCFNCLLAYIRSVGKVALAVATTGIAALQLTGGKTVHIAFKVPIDPSGRRRGLMTLNIKKNSAIGKLILNDLAVLVWDEAPMIHRDIFESIDHTLRDLRDDSRPFGGISVVLGGDFRQCTPVVRGATIAAQVEASILNSPCFAAFRR